MPHIRGPEEIVPPIKHNYYAIEIYCACGAADNVARHNIFRLVEIRLNFTLSFMKHENNKKLLYTYVIFNPMLKYRIAKYIVYI